MVGEGFLRFFFVLRGAERKKKTKSETPAFSSPVCLPSFVPHARGRAADNIS